MFRQNTSSPKTWSLTCKNWTWRRDVSKFGELILWVACSTKTLLSTRIKAFHIFPHTVASNVVFRQKYVLSEKDCLCPVIKKSSQIFEATKLWKHTIPFTYNKKTLISNISETHRFSPQMRLVVYPDHKTTLRQSNKKTLRPTGGTECPESWQWSKGYDLLKGPLFYVYDWSRTSTQYFSQTCSVKQNKYPILQSNLFRQNAMTCMKVFCFYVHRLLLMQNKYPVFYASFSSSHCCQNWIV